MNTIDSPLANELWSVGTPERLQGMHTKNLPSGLVIQKKGSYLEQVSSKALNVDLLVSQAGLELHHSRLYQGERLTLLPSGDRTEIYYLLEGILAYEEGNHKVQLGPQDYLVTSDLESKFILSALSDVEFLYVSSAPGFSEVSQRLNELMQLAVDIEIKDGYTADHCYRIQQLSYRTGLELGLDSNSLFRLDNASYLHDIGKIKVPLEILQKPDKLSMDEWRIMQQHPIFGREFLENTLIKDAAPIVEQHHERLDGSGYPYHLAGDDIMVEASIVAVADSFDAMTTDRPYRARLSREDAYAELKQGAGIVYEQEVVKAFLSAVKKISH